MHNLTRRISGVLWIADVVWLMAALLFAGLWASPAPPGAVKDLLAVRLELYACLLVLAFAVCWHLIFRWQGLYRFQVIERGAAWWEATKAAAIGNGLLWAAATLLAVPAITPSFLTAFFASSFAGALVLHGGVRVLLTRAALRRHRLKHVVIVGCGSRGASLGRKIWKRPGLGCLLLGYVDDMTAPANPLHGCPEKLLGSLDELESLIGSLGIDEVFIALPVKSHYDTIARIIALCETRGVVVRMPANVFERRLATAAIDYLDDATLVTLETTRRSSVELALKRTIDMAGALAALALLSPIFVVVGLAIKFDSPGSVLFRQERVGFRGRTFRMVKFRTMIADAEARLGELEAHNEVRGAAFKMRHDPRVTRVGHLLRKFSVDELPQFLNVLTGEMSLVGPRPLPTRDVRQFDADWQRRRFSVKPGLTCLWQANGRHELSFQHWMELDLQYIDHWSLRLDCEIIARTIPAVLRGGAS